MRNGPVVVVSLRQKLLGDEEAGAQRVLRGEKSDLQACPDDEHEAGGRREGKCSRLDKKQGQEIAWTPKYVERDEKSRHSRTVEVNRVQCSARASHSVVHNLR